MGLDSAGVEVVDLFGSGRVYACRARLDIFVAGGPGPCGPEEVVVAAWKRLGRAGKSEKVNGDHHKRKVQREMKK